MHNPVAAKILNKFIRPEQATKGPDSVIPADILRRAKGLAIMTVVKAGFIWSGRVGTGIVIARLPDGTWSAPSGIHTAGVGVGGQLGVELTDFVIILNTADAVKAFSHGGNVTLGGSLSVAAGPIGRTAEAGGTVGNLAPIFSYSKSKGAFVGVSLEGSVIVERKDANARFYNRKITAQEILGGSVQRPAEAHALYTALDSRCGTGGSAPQSPVGSDINSKSPPSYSATSPSTAAAPPIPQRSTGTAVALYDFEAQRSDDLSFRKGDLITIVRKTDNQNDWWIGRLNGRTGNFPANYVQLQ
jgi:lipid-binding SYLF domain-containing protein